MLDIFSQFATDTTLEDKGVERVLGDAKFLVARTGNSNYTKVLQELVQQNEAALKVKGEVADKLSDKIMVEVIARTVLLGWENVSYKKQPLPYSLDNAIMLLSHKDFRKQITSWADEMDVFRMKEEAEQEKN
jgi:hypothetical protein